MNKRSARLKRASRFRARNRVLGHTRLVVSRSSANIYAQIISFENNQSLVVASASTLDKDLRDKVTGNKKEQAALIGQAIAERAKAKDIVKVAFDRSGFKYHGRVKALAEAAREHGLTF